MRIYFYSRNNICCHTVQSVNPTKVVIRKPVRPEDPPPVSPLLMKNITGNIPKCRAVPNLRPPEWRGSGATTLNFYDAYHYWNKDSKSYQVWSGLRHYHINPVYAQMFRTLNKTIPLGANITPTDGICQIAAQCFGTTLS